MKHYMPVKVYFESGAIANHAYELAQLGTKAMVVTGKHSSRANGSLSDLTRALEQNHVPYVVFDDVEENPSVETVAAAAQIANENGCDFFIGLGGGSPMDAAKAIALLAHNPGQIECAEHALYTEGEMANYPVAEIPTTSGTGSEVTQHTVLTRHASRTKKSIAHPVFASLALVDPSYLRSVSYSCMVSTCVDALAHMLESYLNTSATPFSRLYALEGLRLWGSVKQHLASENTFYEMTNEVRAVFMQASVYAGMAIAHTGTSLPHGLSYPVTYEMHVPHGKAVGYFLPAFLRTYQNADDVKAVLNALGFADLAAFTDMIRTLLGKPEIPAELWKNDVDALMSNPKKLKSLPFSMTRETLQTFFEY